MLESEMLYHYTSFDALCKIVESRIVWATDIKYLNDATEFQYGFNLAKEVYSTLNKREIVPEIRDPKLRSDIEKLLGSNANNKNFGSYTCVFSLSTKGDLLSQWRAYCPNGGVSIGFSKNALERLAEQQRFKLVQCIYEPDEQKEKLRQVLRGWSEHGQPISDFTSFSTAFRRTVASLKHPEFREEIEFRLVSESGIPLAYNNGNDKYSHPQKSKWRGVRTMPIRYTEFLLSDLSEPELQKRFPNIPLEKVLREHTIFHLRELEREGMEPDVRYGDTAIRKIIVGPSARQNFVCEAVQDLIDDKVLIRGRSATGLHPDAFVNAFSSKIPYRPE